MLSKIARTASVRVAAPISMQARFVSANPTLDKRELAQERDWINRAERQLLNDILKKAEGTQQTQSLDALKAILKKFDVKASDALIEELKAWRHTTF